MLKFTRYKYSGEIPTGLRLQFKNIFFVSVVPSMADIQQNLNRPIPVVRQLFFDVLDGLTPSWMVEQVGERKYMMEEDFRRTANYLKAVISPGEKL